MLSSASDKPKSYPANFLKSPNRDDSCISLPAFPSRTNLKIHNIHVIPNFVKNVIINIDLSKASGCDYIPEVCLRKYETKLSHILDNC